MRSCFIALALALGATTTTFAQSGVIEGPFAPGSGNYTTLPGGTFELDDPLGNWWDFSGFSSISRETTPTMRGDWVGRMSGNPAPGFARSNTSYAPLTPGENYVLSGFFRGEEEGGSVEISVLLQGGFTRIATTFIDMTPQAVGRWYFGYTTFTAPVSATYVWIARNNGPFGSNNYFDDIALTRQSDFQAPSAVPEPASLLALGLGGLAVMRRRRVR